MMIGFLKFAKNELEYELIPGIETNQKSENKKDRKKLDTEVKPLFVGGKYEGEKIIEVELFDRFCCGELTEYQKLKYEFDIIKSHVVENNIKFSSNYYKYANENNLEACPNEYFDKYKIWKGWFDLFNIDTSEWFTTKEDWKSYCLSNNITSDNYNKCLITHTKLPTEPELFYSNFTNICNELKTLSNRVRKKIRVIS